MTTTTGRPRSFEHQEVLDRALELFWRNGYRATTTRELEQHLGLSQSSIYNAFGSKRGLLLAALTSYEDRITSELLVPLEAAENGLDGIDQFFDSLAQWVTHDGRRGCMIINLMAEDAGENEGITKRTRAYRERVRSALEKALTRSNVSDAPSRADLLYGMVLGLNIAARGGGLTAEVERLVASAHTVIAGWR
jgi:TetR/AcrR family transcriptional repressor of nem operon